MALLDARWTVRSRARLTALVLVVVALGLTVTLAPAPTASAATTADATATAATTSSASARGATRDFPDFPTHCRQGPSKICRVTTYPRRPWLVLWGDSHALQYLTPVRAIAERRRVNLVLIYAGGCPLSVPFPASSGEPRMTCDKHNAAALDYVRSLVAPHRKLRVVLGSWWDYYRRQHAAIQAADASGVDPGVTPYDRHIARLGVERSAPFFRSLRRAGIAADVLAQAGTVPDQARACEAGEDPYVCDLERNRVLPRLRDNRRWLAGLSRNLARPPIVVDPAPTYCDETVCHGQVRGVNTFFDRAHLGEDLTRTMQPYFRPSFHALLAGS